MPKTCDDSDNADLAFLQDDSAIHSEKLFPLPKAVEKATGQRRHLSTCLRWAKTDRYGVKLESTMLGGRRLTSPEAVLRYMDALTVAKDRS
jgi:hypothetical protein